MSGRLTLRDVQRRLDPHYRQVSRNAVDALGKRWKYKTSPGLPWPHETPSGKGSGPHCYYDSLDEVVAAIDARERIGGHLTVTLDK